MRRLAVILLAILLVVLGSCAKEPARTATSEQTLAGVEAVARDAEQLLPGTRLVSDLPTGPLRTECSEPVDGGSEGRVQWTGYYRLQEPRTLPRAQVVSFLTGIVPRLETRGWLVRDDRRARPDAPEMTFGRNADGFYLAFRGGTIDGIDITVESPCVWPAGVPE